VDLVNKLVGMQRAAGSQSLINDLIVVGGFAQPAAHSGRRTHPPLPGKPGIVDNPARFQPLDELMLPGTLNSQDLDCGRRRQ
jgi:hypothetical protein